MAGISPNRQALKDLSDTMIDFQFCQQSASQVFNYSGEATPTYQQSCGNLQTLIEDVLNGLNTLKSQIPLFQQ